MKKVLLSAFAIMLIFSACKPDDNNTPLPAQEPNNNGGGNEPQEIVVPEVNMSMVTKVTGSLCPPCGSWGWTAFESLINTNKDDAFFVGAYSDNYVARLFITDEAETMERAWGVTGFPTFAANGMPQLDRNSGVNVQSEISKTNAVVASHKSGEVFVNSGFRTSVDANNIMTIETKTKFFKDVGGDIFVAVYVIEDKVIGAQSGHPDGANASHHYVLRGAAKLDGAAKAETWGYQIGNPGATITPANTEVENTFTIDVSNYDQANTSVAVVIYRKVGVRYQFLNAYSNQK
jgi:hypothetical protein